MTDTKWKITPGEWELVTKGKADPPHPGTIIADGRGLVIHVDRARRFDDPYPDALAISRVPQMLELAELLAGMPVKETDPIAKSIQSTACALLKGLHEDYPK